MRQRDKLLMGALAGGGVLLGARAWLRSRRRIELDDRVVVITGGSTGLGLIAARQAARQGARLVLAARGVEELRAAEEELRQDGARDVIGLPTDVTDPEQVDALIDETIDRHGRVDILINNAGTILVGPLETMTVDDFREVMATNFWGNLYPTLAVLPHMRRRGFGRIGNVSSVGGKIAMPHLLPYTASKFALTGLSEGLRAELAGENILVTSVYPGTIRTGGHTHARFKGNAEAEYAWFAASDTLPLASTSAHAAARKLWDAVRHGDAEAIIGWNAKLAIVFHDLLPDWFAETMALVDRALPGVANLGKPAVRGGDLEGMIPETFSRMIPGGTRPEPS